MRVISKIVQKYIRNRTIYFSVVIMSIAFQSKAQNCIETPEINGSPANYAAPVGWSVWYGTPDVISGNGVYPTGVPASIADVNATSTAGGEMAFLLINAVNGNFTESIQKTISGLVPGNLYSLVIDWQQATLDYAITTNDFSGGKLEVFIDGVSNSVHESTGGYDDGWQSATVQFTATSHSHVLGIKGKLLDGASRGAIVVDNGFCPTVLPVMLYDFQVNVQQQLANLTWNATAETSQNHFKIQKTLDGLIWDSIGVVPVNNELITYRFVDPEIITQDSYYRLSWYDANGIERFSEVKVAHVSDLGNQVNIAAYPNPVNDLITIEGKIDELHVTTAQGQLIPWRSLAVFVSENKAIVNLSTLATGIYFFQNTQGAIRVVKN